MIVLTLVVFGIPVALWFARRARRRAVLAGRDSERPTYAIEPPGRRMGRLKDGRL